MATLEALPIELIERIATLLSTRDVGNLRLTCRELRNKASQGHYLQLFISHNVDLLQPSLERMTKILAEDNLSRRLRNLRITAVLHESANPENVSPFLRGEFWDPHLLSRGTKSACLDEKRAKEDAEEARKERIRHAKLCLERTKHQYDVESGAYPKLLKAALDSVKTHCLAAGAPLESLTLKCVVENGDDLRWDLKDWDQQHRGFSNHVSYLFTTSVDALIESGLSVRKLDLFSGTRFCSLPCTEMAPYLASHAQKDITAVMSKTTSLAVSFSRLAGDDILFPRLLCCNCNSRAKLRPDEEIMCHYHRCDFEEEGDNYCVSETSLAKFLSCFENIDTLDLHQYEIERESDKYNGVTFAAISHNNCFVHLRNLTLRGVSTDEQSLIAFLSNHPSLESLDMRAINLNEGQWHGVFTHIKTKLPKLNYLKLSNLFEHKRPDNVTQPAGGNIHAFAPVPLPPPPPPQMHNPWAALPPPPVITNTTSTTDTYLNTLLSFRVMNVMPENVDSGGVFKNNKIVLKGEWIGRADILYGFVSHAANKWKLERKWNAKMYREYGPPKDIIIDI